jgi:hypothetical protein
MSIVRVGLAETKDFSDGYEAIFGKKEKPADAKGETKPEEKQETKAEKKK